MDVTTIDGVKRQNKITNRAQTAYMKEPIPDELSAPVHPQCTSRPWLGWMPMRWNCSPALIKPAALLGRRANLGKRGPQ
jgi:hypothetical protein